MSSENLDRCDPNDPILLPEIKHEDEADRYYRTNAPGWERIVRIEANGKRTPLNRSFAAGADNGPASGCITFTRTGA